MKVFQFPYNILLSNQVKTSPCLVALVSKYSDINSILPEHMWLFVLEKKNIKLLEIPGTSLLGFVLVFMTGRYSDICK